MPHATAKEKRRQLRVSRRGFAIGHTIGLSPSTRRRYGPSTMGWSWQVRAI